MDADARSGAPLRHALIAACVSAILVFLARRAALSLELLGWDAYPLIAAGRLEGALSVFTTFGESLMEGQYAYGSYWRPLVHLSFGLDYALWGLNPFGYHLTDLIVTALCAAGVALLAARVFGFGLIASLLAGGLVALHPVQIEVLAAPARRADSLAVLFTILALLVQGRRPASMGWGRGFGVGLACAAALAAKETGAVATVAVVARWLTMGGPRSGRVMRALLPVVLVVGLAFALRTFVLGGLGGPLEGSLAGGLRALPARLGQDLMAVLFPSALPTLSRKVPLGIWGFLLSLFLYLFTTGRLYSSDFPGDRRAGAKGVRVGDVVFLGVWAAGLATITAMADADQAWYALPFVPLLALLLGSVADRLPAGVHRSPAWSIAACFCLIPPVGFQLWAGLQPQNTSELVEASRLQESFLERLTADLEGAQSGTRLEVRDCPAELVVMQGEQIERRIFQLSDYSVQAFVQLTFPDRKLRVAKPGEPLQPAADEVLLMLYPKPSRWQREVDSP